MGIQDEMRDAVERLGIKPITASGDERPLEINFAVVWAFRALAKKAIAAGCHEKELSLILSQLSEELLETKPD